MIALVIWFSGVGYIHGFRESWEDCQKAMDALEKVKVEAS